jgi:membrane-associated phospholipid phosphatase
MTHRLWKRAEMVANHRKQFLKRHILGYWIYGRTTGVNVSRIDLGLHHP